MRCDAICARADCRGPVGLDNGLVVEVGPGCFEEMVLTALDGLPGELGQLESLVSTLEDPDTSKRAYAYTLDAQFTMPGRAPVHGWRA